MYCIVIYCKFLELYVKKNPTKAVGKSYNVGSSSKTSTSEPKFFNINDKTIFKVQELSNGKITFEYNKKNIDGNKDKIVEMTLEALDEFIINCPVS